MKILFFDPYHGAAGDMVVGALLDVGVPFERIREPLDRMLAGEAELSAERVTRAGIAAWKFHVRPTRPEGGHPHRHLSGVLEIIDGAGLSDWVSEKAHACFRKLAEIEAAIHGTTPEKVHFHEVGAIDSIADTVGALLAVEHIQPDRICSAPVAVGSGVTECAHGVMPLPVPATAALLKGFPTRQVTDAHPDLVDREMCTPTGAMLLTTLAEPVAGMPPMKIENIGYGAGSREDPGAANVLRAVTGELVESETSPLPSPDSSLYQVECVIDDMPGEQLGFLFERLGDAGAVEVVTQAVGLKKSRPGVRLTALVPPDALKPVRDAIFAETTTFGMRYFPVRRFVLDREHVEVQTPWGPVCVKVGSLDGTLVTASPEYEDCRKLAEENGVPLREVFAAATDAYRRGSGEW